MPWKAENAISETLYFKNFQLTMPPDPPPPRRPHLWCLWLPPPPHNKSNPTTAVLTLIEITLPCSFAHSLANSGISIKSPPYGRDKKLNVFTLF